MPAKRPSAHPLEAFEAAALEARHHPRRRVLLGLALTALRDDPADALGLFTAYRDLAAPAGSRRRLLALPPPDPGVLDYAVEHTDDGVVVVVLRGLRWRLRRPPRLGPRHSLAHEEGWTHATGPGLTGRQRSLVQYAQRLLRWAPDDALGVLEVAKGGDWPLRLLRLPLGAGEVVYEVEEAELLVRLHDLRWDWP